MPLVLAVHTVLSPSATVPFAVILLQDHISNKKIPADFKCRQLVPSSGATSTSLWDVSDPQALQEWLEEAINVDVTHAVFPVQEEFAIGLSEVARAQAADKVVLGTKDVAEKTGRALGTAATAMGAQVNEIDHKLRISERATAASAAIKESAVGRSTSAALGRVGTAVSGGARKVMENDTVATATTAVGASFKKFGASLSGVMGRRRDDGGSGTDTPPQFVGGDAQEGYQPPYQPPPQQAAYQMPARGGSGSMHSAGSAGTAEEAAPAVQPPVAPKQQQQQARAEAPTFTLDDNESHKP